ncbi:unnamed protein product [Ascophyllum nodosum]
MVHRAHCHPARTAVASPTRFRFILFWVIVSLQTTCCGGAWLAKGVRVALSARRRHRFGEVLFAFCPTAASGRLRGMMEMSNTPGEVAADHISWVDTEESASALVRKYDNFVFDCDGVLWAGSHDIEGSIDTVKALRRAGKRTFFVTNNASKSRRQYCLKLEGFGVSGVGVEDIVTSGSALAAYVKRAHPDVHTVYMIGENGQGEELEMAGFKIAKETTRPPVGMTEDEFRVFEPNPEVGAVVVGLDTSFGFRQLCAASTYIQRGAHFVGTNPDIADRVGDLLMPGTGPLLASIQTASGVAPVVVGKPNPLLLHQLMDLNGLDPSSTVMVGDRLDTDIKFGNAAGVSSALVLTGVSEAADVVGLPADGEKTPTYLMEKLAFLLSAAEAAATKAPQSSAFL